MAELIDREAFLKRFTSEYRCKFTFGEAKILNVMFEELKKEATTTEAEIRAKAIDEFAEKLNKKFTDFILEHQNQLTFVSGVSMGWKFVDEIAKQLKEE